MWCFRSLNGIVFEEDDQEQIDFFMQLESKFVPIEINLGQGRTQDKVLLYRFMITLLRHLYPFQVMK